MVVNQHNLPHCSVILKLGRGSLLHPKDHNIFASDRNLQKEKERKKRKGTKRNSKRVSGYIYCVSSLQEARTSVHSEIYCTFGTSKRTKDGCVKRTFFLFK